MTKRRNEVKAAVNTVVYNIAPIQATFITKESFKLIINVLNYCSEAERKMILWSKHVMIISHAIYLLIKRESHQSVLSIASPKPGVSTTVKRNLTPRSSISTVEASSFTVWFAFSEKKKKVHMKKWINNLSISVGNNSAIKVHPGKFLSRHISTYNVRFK